MFFFFPESVFFKIKANVQVLNFISGFRRAFLSGKTERRCENPQLLTVPTPLYNIYFVIMCRIYIF
jgi:hypothetical protein